MDCLLIFPRLRRSPDSIRVDPPGGVGDAWADNAAPTADIVRLLLNRRIGALPVLKDEKVVGIIIETDMIHLEEAQDMQ
jgi:CBS-domain-containing membrane protein